MKNNLRPLIVAAAGAFAVLGISSCAYDPYYSSTSVGGSYSSGYGYGYGDGYGYGGNRFSTSVFVSTGDPRWGYDPTCYSYYDYSRRSYYDPYLNGYYPVGYRPPVVYGVPHPYGWSPGRGYCPPPRRVSYSVISNYRDRESRYRNSDYGWARQVRSEQRGPQRGYATQDPDRRSYSRQESQGRTSGRQSTNVRPSGGSYNSDRESQRREVNPQPRYRENQKQYSSPKPSRYETPVNYREQARQQRSPQSYEKSIRSSGGEGGRRQESYRSQGRSEGREEQKRSGDDDGRMRGQR